MPTGRISAPAWTSPEALETDPDEMLSLHQELFSIGARLRKPMVSAVQGAALAGGLGLALNAHIVVASADARFGLTEVRVGLWPYVIFPVVAAAVGYRKATELALTARIVDVEEACRIGIVDVVVEPERCTSGLSGSHWSWRTEAPRRSNRGCPSCSRLWDWIPRRPRTGWEVPAGGARLGGFSGGCPGLSTRSASRSGRRTQVMNGGA